jgi:thioredoxin reductase
VLGHDGRPPAEILADGRAQLLAYPTAELVADAAVDARAVEGGFEVSLASGAGATARRLILATGVVDEPADVPGLRERWGRTVLHCPYCHGFEVGDRRLGVLAVVPASVHQALLVADWSADVTLFTAGTVELDGEQRAQLAARGVRVEERPVAALVGDAPGLEGVRLADGEVVAVDALFTGAFTRPASPLAERLGCAFDEGMMGPIVRTDERQQTTVPGVYAAGDLARSMTNVNWALADGMNAGVSCHQSLVFPPPS